MKRVLFLGLIGLLTVSCSQMTVLRTRELTEVQVRVDSLRAEMIAFDEKWQKAREEESRKEERSRVATELMLSRISEMIMQLSGNVAESQSHLSEISRRTDLISAQMAERARQDSLMATIQEFERSDLFNLARANFDKGNFTLAIRDFTDYIERYPETTEAEYALFFKAESHFALDSLDIAETLYKQYFSEHREGRFACSALYKLGLIYEKQGRTRSRDAVWGQLERQCPESIEFRLLQENHRR